MSWNTAEHAALAGGHGILIDDPGRCEGVAVVGVDERAWQHTCRETTYVTAIIDLTPDPRRPRQAVGHGRGPLRGGVRGPVG